MPQAESAEVSSAGVLEVTIATPEPDEPCTSDLVPRVTLVSVPEDVDPEQDLEIEVNGEDYLGTGRARRRARTRPRR